MNSSFLNSLINETPDDDIFSKINHEQFFKILKEENIDIDQIVLKRKKNDYLPFHKFNFILKELHYEKKICMTESCVFLLNEMLDVKDTLSCLNDENRYILRTSLAERHNKKLKRSTLDMFMYRKKKSKNC